MREKSVKLMYKGYTIIKEWEVILKNLQL
jgi:hypothetical protein